MPPDLSLKRLFLACVGFIVFFGIPVEVALAIIRRVFGWGLPSSLEAAGLGILAGLLWAGVLRRFRQGSCGWLRVGSPLWPLSRPPAKYDY